MNFNFEPKDHVLWYVSQSETKPCTQNLDIEVAIVGGGIAGLSAAQEFAKQGKKVAIFEQYFCGSGATGKSSGFVTPNAELSLTDFATRFNFDVAHQIWDLISSGVTHIADNIKQHNFNCDYQVQDAFVLATSKSELKTLQREHENLTKIGYESKIYDQNFMQNIINSNQYFGALQYFNSFSFNPYLYCQELKNLLQSQGVLIFEQTPITQIFDHILIAPHATITADFIIVCVDHNFANLNLLKDNVFHAQTFVMASEQLSDAQIKNIFPNGHVMAWDTQLIYNYFRITKDKRLLLGGGDIFTSYANNETHNYHRITKKLCRYFTQKFPQINLQFEYQWPGLIGLSKDISPIIGRDQKFPHIYYVTAATGLATAAALGKYSAQHLIQGRNNFDHHFSPYRKFPVDGLLQKIIGKRLSFILSNIIKLNIP
ncbi:FAD-binding oxidoreductase [Candidatus Babeliales bacterium]|nr:FAD-binding oxidoreductase [Candidatus Babeliales bacterium]